MSSIPSPMWAPTFTIDSSRDAARILATIAPGPSTNGKKRTQLSEIPQKKSKMERAQAASVNEESISPLQLTDEEFIEERTKVIRAARCRLQTKQIHTVLPAFLQPFTDSISVEAPFDQTRIFRQNGAEDGAFALDGIQIAFRIVPSRSENHKILKISADMWHVRNTASGCWQAEMTVEYRGLRRTQRGEASAKLYESEDRRRDVYTHSTEGMKDVMLAVIEDMGHEGMVDDDQWVELLYKLSGYMGKKVLKETVKGVRLFDIIRDGLTLGSQSPPS